MLDGPRGSVQGVIRDCQNVPLDPRGVRRRKGGVDWGGSMVVVRVVGRGQESKSIIIIIITVFGSSGETVVVKSIVQREPFQGPIVRVIVNIVGRAIQESQIGNLQRLESL